MILVGSGCKGIGRKLLGFNVVEIDVKRFPDDETYVRIPVDVKDRNVFYLQSFYPNQNDVLMEAFLTIDALFDMEVKSVTPIFTYFPYSKQDKIFKNGEALSVKTVLKIFKNLDINKIFFINSHFLKKPGVMEKFGVECLNLNVAPLLIDYVAGRHDEFVIILPGEGARYLLEGKNFDNILYFKTERKKEYKTSGDKTYREVEIYGESSEVKNKTVVVLDDMISTGGTMVKICESVKSNAKKVIASAVHGLFVGNALKNLNNVADEIITTDTVETEFSKVSIAEEIAKVLKESI